MSQQDEAYAEAGARCDQGSLPDLRYVPGEGKRLLPEGGKE